MRLISLCLALCLVFCCVVPVSAAEEYTYELFGDVENGYALELSDFPFVPGDVVIFSFSFSFDEFSFSSIPTSFLLISFEDDGSIIGFDYSVPLFFDNQISNMFASGFLYFASIDDLSSLLFSFSIPNTNFSPDSVTVTLSSDPGGAFINPITDAIPVVLGWFGLMLTGITSGKLSVLWSICCIGIAVAVVFVVIKIIKRFSWGT